MAAVFVLAAGTYAERRLASRGWARYSAVPAAGPIDAAVATEFLGESSPTERFGALFSYLTAGFFRYADPSFARIQYPGAGSINGYRVNGLEGFARTAPLLAAWVYGGRSRTFTATPGGEPVDLIEALRTGLLAGVDPASEDYWGNIRDYDQRVVEAADVARLLWLTRTSIWEKLDASQQQHIENWLLAAAAAKTARSNWMLFPVLCDLVLARLDPGLASRRGLVSRAHEAFAVYRRNYLQSGWFYDYPHGVDFYNAWGISYDLYWITLFDPSFEVAFIRSAIHESAALTALLISPKGIPIMGRSICYRTAVPVPLLAAGLLAADDVEGHLGLRALDVVWRYFIARGSLRDGALTQGYFLADLRFLDVYSGTGSCHWGLRSLVLAFMHADSDGFWSDPERPLPVEQSDFNRSYSKLGWSVTGRRATGEISIEIAANPAGRPTVENYGPLARFGETILRRPLRPGNYPAKYEARHYSSAAPFPVTVP